MTASRAISRTFARVGALVAAAALAGLAIGLLVVGSGGAAAVTTTTTTFTPVADSYVQADTPTTNYGTSTQLRTDGSPITRAYLRFSVQGLAGPVTSAVLRVHTNSSHSTGYTVSGVADTTWGETTITSNNAPPVGSSVGSSGAFASGVWTQVDVTGLVTGNGLVSMALSTTSATAMSLGSRESGANGPQLVVTSGASDTTPPAAPTGVQANATGATTATVSWAANTESDLAGYRVFRAPSGGTPAQVGTTAAGVTTFQDTGLKPSTAYDYTVVAVDSSNNASAPSSPPATVTTQADTSAPSTPGNLKATPSGSSAIALSWNASTDNVGVAAYDVFRDGGATPIASPTTTSFTDSGLAPSSAHSYTVVARDAAGNTSAAAGPVSATTAAPGGDPVIAAAGDIACGTGYVGSYCVQMQTSNLILGINPTAVLALGDIQYEQSAYSDYVDASTNPKIGYDKSWGRFKPKTYPAIGNHEYLTPIATNYLKYWSQYAAKQGPWANVSGHPELGYYSFDVGAWHLISFNSNCGQVSCSAGSPQETWIKADLAAHPTACTLVFAHHPFRNSFFETSNEPRYPALFQDFYNAGVDLLLVGHAHDYERTAPMDPAGNIDMGHGVREFVVGTGGHGPTGTSATPKPFSQAHASPVFGALVLTLHPTSYDWSFKGIPGYTFTDSGSLACH